MPVVYLAELVYISFWVGCLGKATCSILDFGPDQTKACHITQQMHNAEGRNTGDLARKLLYYRIASLASAQLPGVQGYPDINPVFLRRGQ